MLVNPGVQQTSYTAQPAPVPNGVGQQEVVRSDLPPIEQSPESDAGQNQQLFNERKPDSSAAQNPQSASATQSEDQVAQPGDQSSASDGAATQSGRSNAANESAQDERRAEQQRQEDAAIIRQLKARDREVRLHEAAHAAVGGRYAGAPTVQYERGPDGVNYAVSGEVSISVSKAATPEETLDKARQIRAAATAPAEPSAQDRRVAAEASRLELEARADLQAQEVEQREQRAERAEQRRTEQQQDERVEEDSEVVEEQTTELPQIGNDSELTPSIADNAAQQPQEQQTSADDDETRQEDSKTAKEQLEEILLGNQSVPQALNEAGFVDANNPYGKSGFIEYIV